MIITVPLTEANQELFKRLLTHADSADARALQVAQAAGFVNGKGGFSLARDTHGVSYVRLTIASQQPEVQEAIRHLAYTFALTTSIRSRGRANVKPELILQTQGGRLALVIQELRPYLSQTRLEQYEDYYLQAQTLNNRLDQYDD